MPTSRFLDAVMRLASASPLANMPDLVERYCLATEHRGLVDVRLFRRWFCEFAASDPDI
jgi:hypothetical protein